MASRVEITTAEILDALAVSRRPNDPEGAKTIQELMRETGFEKTKVTSGVRRLWLRGRVVVHQVLRAGMDGKMRPVPAYTILPAKRK